MLPESINGLWLRIKALFRWRQLERDLADELEFHLAMREQKLAESGVAPEEARHAARRQFGNATRAKEANRELWTFPFAETLWQDIRYGVRMLRKSPGFTIVAIVTLALGIGANTAIFSTVEADLLRPLPIRDPQHVVVFNWGARREPHLRGRYTFETCPGNNAAAHGCTFSYPVYKRFRKLREAFSGIAAIGGRSRWTLTGSGAARNVGGEVVSGNFFKMLGVGAAVGRTIEPSDDLPGATPVAVLSYGYWQRDFGGNPAVIGKTIELNRVPVTIVGVIEKRFPGLSPGSSNDIWLPLSVQPLTVGKNGWFGFQSGEKPSVGAPDNVWWVYVLARLRRGVSLTRAQAVADVIFRNRVLHAHEAIFRPSDAPRLMLMRAPEGIVGNRAGLFRPLMILMFAVGIILLVACANVAGLMIARSSARRREVTVRLALGATRAWIVRHLLIESVTLSAAGGALGILLAYWGSRALVAFVPAVHLDAHVLAFTTAISLASGVVSGLAPALRTARLDLAPALKEATDGVGRAPHGRGPFSLGNGLVVAQVALSVMALAGAGLLVRTLANLEGIKPGFDPRNVLLFGIDPTLQGYNGARCQRLYTQLRRRLAGLPGVQSVSYSYDMLLDGSLTTTSFRVVGSARQKEGATDLLYVGPNFTQTMGIPLVVGRRLRVEDFAPKLSPRPLVVNQSFVRQAFGRQNPLGRLVKGFGGCDPDCRIVGVAGDARYQTLLRTIHPTVYVPQSGGSTYFEIRTASDPRGLIPAVRSLAGELDSNLPLYQIETQRELIQALYLTRPRRIARQSSFFALLALMLACLGLYGLLSYEVTRRRREIGIRVALGAQGRDVMRRFLGRGMALVGVGAAAGLVISLGVTRYVASLLYGVKPVDPLTDAGVLLLLAAVALLACYVPARRAVRVDPVVALRQE